MKCGRIFTWASAAILTVFWSVAEYVETLPASAFDGVNPDAALREAMTALRTELETELSQVVLRLPLDALNF
ncbi:hypothetical protein FACS1894158_09040 [Betaproteobacteria bacterium]|nr:hypothetical protein FACS1894158_09040 [Betaproteobacteria bacterium]